MKETTKKRLLRFANMAALVILAFILGLYSSQLSIFMVFLPGVPPALPNVQNAAMYTQVWNLLHTDYYCKKLDNTSLLYASISGMVDSLNDPATLFLSPQGAQQFTDVSAGNTFAGIGVELGYQNNNLIIQRIVPGGPAASSRLVPGDELLQINGKSVTGVDIATVTNDIRGTAGTTLTLEIQNGSASPFTLTLTRAAIHVDSMYVTTTKASNGDKVDDLVISRFTDTDLPTWESQWDSAIQQIKTDNPAGVVIDLRDNPGGFVQAAVYGLSDLLPKNSLAVVQEGKGNVKTRFETQTAPRLANTVKVTVLVNSETASAAEIFSGALQYYHRATIIGENTYGKGTEQEVITFPNGAELHVTIDHWLLPSGRWIQKGSPIKPDIEMPYTNADFTAGNDTQMNKALSLL